MRCLKIIYLVVFIAVLFYNRVVVSEKLMKLIFSGIAFLCVAVYYSFDDISYKVSILFKHRKLIAKPVFPKLHIFIWLIFNMIEQAELLNSLISITESCCNVIVCGLKYSMVKRINFVE